MRGILETEQAVREKAVPWDRNAYVSDGRRRLQLGQHGGRKIRKCPVGKWNAQTKSY